MREYIKSLVALQRNLVLKVKQAELAAWHHELLVSLVQDARVLARRGEMAYLQALSRQLLQVLATVNELQGECLKQGAPATAGAQPAPAAAPASAAPGAPPEPALAPAAASMVVLASAPQPTAAPASVPAAAAPDEPAPEDPYPPEADAAEACPPEDYPPEEYPPDDYPPDGYEPEAYEPEPESSVMPAAPAAAVTEPNMTPPVPAADPATTAAAAPAAPTPAAAPAAPAPAEPAPATSAPAEAAAADPADPAPDEAAASADAAAAASSADAPALPAIKTLLGQIAAAYRPYGIRNPYLWLEGFPCTRLEGSRTVTVHFAVPPLPHLQQKAKALQSRHMQVIAAALLRAVRSAGVPCENLRVAVGEATAAVSVDELLAAATPAPAEANAAPAAQPGTASAAGTAPALSAGAAPAASAGSETKPASLGIGMLQSRPHTPGTAAPVAGPGAAAPMRLIRRDPGAPAPADNTPSPGDPTVGAAMSLFENP